MGRYSSYYLYQKYERRCTACTDADWVPCYPNVYSLSGDSTNPMALVEKSSADTACGYIPCQTQERWVDIPITEDYECDYCDVGYEYRYVPCEVSAYTYIGDYKYEVLCEQKSEDGGVTWVYTQNTKISDTPIERVSSKVQLTMYNGDIFAQSCQENAPFYSQNTPQKTLNIPSSGGSFILPTGDYMKSHSKDLVLGECVYEIGGGSSDTYTHPTSKFSGASGWNLESVTFPNTLKWIGNSTFNNNLFTSLTFPTNLQRIGDKSFSYNRRLFDVSLNDNMSRIGNSGFSYCSILQRIELPSNLSDLGSNVFLGCNLLRQVIFKTQSPPSNSLTLGVSGNNFVNVYVPCGTKSAYVSSIKDVPSSRIIEYGSGCGDIPNINILFKPMVTYTQGNITNTIYNIPVSSDTTATFDSSLITNLGLLDSLIIHNGVRCTQMNLPNVRKFVFYNEGEHVNLLNSYTDSNPETAATQNNYQSFTEEVVVNSNIVLNTYSFGGNNRITSVTINSYSTIWSAFEFCEGLKEVYINSNCILKNSVFHKCYNLTDVYISYSGSVVNIDNGDEDPFYYITPTVHVPCELYDSYKNHSFWGGMNIVRNSDDCVPYPITEVVETSGLTLYNRPYPYYAPNCNHVYGFDGNYGYMIIDCYNQEYIDVYFELYAERTSYIYIYLDGISIGTITVHSGTGQPSHKTSTAKVGIGSGYHQLRLEYDVRNAGYIGLNNF